MPLRDETVARVMTMWRNPTDRVQTVSVVDLCGERFFYAHPSRMPSLDGVDLRLDAAIAALGDDAGEVIGRVRLAYADETVARLVPHDDLEKIRDDDPRMAEAAAAADPEDWRESSAGDASDGRFILCVDGVIAAIASYGIWDDAVGSIGVYTRAGDRGRGLSGRAASAAIIEIFERGFPAQWQSRDWNTASERVADKLGFVTLGGRDIVRVRPLSG